MTPTPRWMRNCAGHAFYRRGEVETSLPVANWRDWERRGWSYVAPDRDSADFHSWTFREVFGLDEVVGFPGNREVLRVPVAAHALLIRKVDRMHPVRMVDRAYGVPLARRPFRERELTRGYR